MNKNTSIAQKAPKFFKNLDIFLGKFPKFAKAPKLWTKFILGTALYRTIYLEGSIPNVTVSNVASLMKEGDAGVRCTVCNKQFNRTWNLKAHMVIAAHHAAAESHCSG